jgi:predicted ATP-grasp superfamily ATP-dependent carboligase
VTHPAAGTGPDPDAPARILVTDGESRTALATVRALGARGYDVNVIAARPRSLAGASRHASHEHVLGDAATDLRGWAQGLERVVREHGIDLVIPISEISFGTIYAQGLNARLPIACPAESAYIEAVDKHALLSRAASLGLASPRGFLVERPGSLRELPASFDYPVVVKARRSRFLRCERWESGVARIAHAPAELRAALDDPGMAAGALLQEFVEGHGESVCLLASEGRTLARFAHRRLREKPPTGGESVLRESIAPDPPLLAASERLLQAFRWSGVAMLEFRRTPDGRALLMEMNPRLWGSVQLAIDAGVDFPGLLVALYRGAKIPSVEAVVGVRTRWLLGDLDHLAISLRRRAVRRRIGVSVARLLLDFGRSFVDGTRLEVLRWDDWRPFARELATRFARG